MVLFVVTELSATVDQTGKSYMSNFNGINSPPSEDRYAALKDLDSMMKKTQLKEDNLTSSATSPSWITTNSNSKYYPIFLNVFQSIVRGRNRKIITTIFFYITRIILLSLAGLWGSDQSHAISNPFTGTDSWRPSVHVMNNNNMPSVDNTLCSSANPFRQTQFPFNNGELVFGN